MHLFSSFMMMMLLVQVKLLTYFLIEVHISSLLVFAVSFERLNFLEDADFLPNYHSEFERCSDEMFFGFAGLVNFGCSCCGAFAFDLLSISQWSFDLSHFASMVTVVGCLLYFLILAKWHLGKSCFQFFCLTVRLSLFDSFDDLHSVLATGSWLLGGLGFYSMRF